MKYTIFSIDNVSDWHTVSKFMRHIDTLASMGKTKGNFIQCIGKWKDSLESSFLCLTEDFVAHVKPFGYVDKQECVMQVSGEGRMRCQLVWADGSIESIGHLHSYKSVEGLNAEGWTYRPDLGLYWVAS